MKKQSEAIVIIMITIFLMGVILPVNAKDLNQLEKELNNVNSAMNKAQQGLKSVQTQKKGVSSELEKLDMEIDKTEDELSSINKLLQESEEKIKQKENELVNASQVAEEQFEMLQLRARTMYEDGNATYLEVLFASENFGDFISRLEIVREIVEYDNNLLAQLKENKNKIEKAKEIAEAEKDNREKIKNRVVAVKEDLGQKQVSRSQLMQRLSQEEKEYAKQLDALEQTSKQVEKEIKRLQEENKRKYAGGKLEWPTPGVYRITSPFGNRWHPILKKNSMHTGVDIGASSGTDVKSANDGQVIMATWNGGYGQCIIIDHGGGIATLYAHNSKLLVKAGQEVKRGQTISKVGSTGWSTGPHLHYEVREGGSPVNPMKYYPE
ncbi:MAG: murein hydrolase activator EnvC [Clostridia bacterium]